MMFEIVPLLMATYATLLVAYTAFGPEPIKTTRKAIMMDGITLGEHRDVLGRIYNVDSFVKDDKDVVWVNLTHVGRGFQFQVTIEPLSLEWIPIKIKKTTDWLKENSHIHNYKDAFYS